MTSPITRTVDDDVADFMQRYKDVTTERDQLIEEVHRTRATSAELERELTFIRTKLTEAEYDRDLYRLQYITLDTELTGLVTDAENFRSTVQKSLDRSRKAMAISGADQRNPPRESQQSDEGAAEMGRRFGSGTDGDDHAGDNER